MSKSCDPQGLDQSLDPSSMDDCRGSAEPSMPGVLAIPICFLVQKVCRIVNAAFNISKVQNVENNNALTKLKCARPT